MADTPQTPERLCEQCKHRPVPPSRGTKPRRYCGRSCVQRAYEERQQQRAVVAALKEEKEREHEQLRAALHAAEARQGKSREDERAPAAKSREDAADQQERSRRKSREDASAPAPGRPKRVVDYFAGMSRSGW